MDKEERDLQILLSLHQNLRANQELYVNQKWKTMHFAFLLYAGLYFIQDACCSPTAEPFIIILLVVVLISSTLLLILHDGSLATERVADSRFQKHELINKAHKRMYRGTSSCNRSCLIHWIFQALNIMGFVSVLVLILAY